MCRKRLLSPPSDRSLIVPTTYSTFIPIRPTVPVDKHAKKYSVNTTHIALLHTSTGLIIKSKMVYK